MRGAAGSPASPSAATRPGRKGDFRLARRRSAITAAACPSRNSTSKPAARPTAGGSDDSRTTLRRRIRAASPPSDNFSSTSSATRGSAAASLSITTASAVAWRLIDLIPPIASSVSAARAGNSPRSVARRVVAPSKSPASLSAFASASPRLNASPDAGSAAAAAHPTTAMPTTLASTFRPGQLTRSRCLRIMLCPSPLPHVPIRRSTYLRGPTAAARHTAACMARSRSAASPMAETLPCASSSRYSPNT